MSLWGEAAFFCLAVFSAPQQTSSDVERLVAELQQQGQWGSPAHRRLNDLDAKSAPDLVPLITKIERPHALTLVGQKLAHVGLVEAIPALITTLSRRYPGSKGNTHPALEPLKSFGWKAIGPLVKAMDSNDYATVFYSAQLLQEQSRFRPEDKRLMPVMLRLSKSRNPEFEIISARALYSLAFRTTGGWMGETPVVYYMENREALGGLIDVLLSGGYSGREEAGKFLVDVLRHVGTDGQTVDLGTRRGESLAIYLASHEAYLNNKTPEVRMTSLALLARYEKTGMSHLAALGDSEEAVRQTAIKALMIKFDPAWLPETAKHLKAMNPGVRASAAKAMGWSFLPSAATLLREHLGDKNAGVRKAVKDAIDRIEGKPLHVPAETEG